MFCYCFQNMFCNFLLRGGRGGSWEDRSGHEGGVVDRGRTVRGKADQPLANDEE